ncbi:OmpA family protein [Lelliottia sp. V106_10]|uniref:OmpA family protein n=1 Tax=Lelliottia wanjuensis TaxID=3050585 RepID=UPI00254DAB4F|nr:MULTISPECIES: OmpA family protein [unclassified Lelliottia]MDK9357611.1 OmpA family protein [Lelliottia sp. V106_16]MDK9372897.1 OmpA family protein [Lelliottia sp. V106_10]MDK9599701.1 OmpA family protein [Lelliottia sp. V106_5]
MLRRSQDRYPILLVAALLLATGIYPHPAWNALFAGLTVLFFALTVREVLQKETPPSPLCEMPRVEKQIYLVVGPYVNQWFSARHKGSIEHSATGALWLCAATQGEMTRQLARLGADPQNLKVTLFFPFFPDGHDSTALAISSLQEWRNILQSPILAAPLPCIFALYVRCSDERFTHDPDSAIWLETPDGEQKLTSASVENLRPQSEGDPAFLHQRHATLLLLWQWMDEEQVLSNLNAALSHASSTLKRIMIADYGTGFTRHGAWSRWLEEHFAILPALSHAKIYPPLPALAATVDLPPVSRSITAPSSGGHVLTPRFLLIVPLLVFASLTYAHYHEQQRADDITRTINSLSQTPLENISQTFSLLDTLEAQRAALENCASSLFFQNWGLSRCRELVGIADTQLGKYSHWSVYSSSSHASLFASGSATILQGREQLLQPMVQLIKKNPEITFLIVGHTDSSGDEKSNALLSEQRAREVRDWLLRNTPATEQQFVLKGEGDAYPLASNSTSAGKELNRRIDVFPLRPTPINVNEHLF